VETFVRQWLVTHDTDYYQHGTEDSTNGMTNASFTAGTMWKNEKVVSTIKPELFLSEIKTSRSNAKYMLLKLFDWPLS
jgi:hypothetical protein